MTTLPEGLQGRSRAEVQWTLRQELKKEIGPQRAGLWVLNEQGTALRTMTTDELHKREAQHIARVAAKADYAAMQAEKREREEQQEEETEAEQREAVEDEIADANREWMPRHFRPIFPLCLARYPDGRMNPDAVLLRNGEPANYVVQSIEGCPLFMPRSTVLHFQPEGIDLGDWQGRSLPTFAGGRAGRECWPRPQLTDRQYRVIELAKLLSSISPQSSATDCPEPAFPPSRQLQ